MTRVSPLSKRSISILVAELPFIVSSLLMLSPLISHTSPHKRPLNTYYLFLAVWPWTMVIPFLSLLLSKSTYSKTQTNLSRKPWLQNLSPSSGGSSRSVTLILFSLSLSNLTLNLALSNNTRRPQSRRRLCFIVYNCHHLCSGFYSHTRNFTSQLKSLSRWLSSLRCRRHFVPHQQGKQKGHQSILSSHTRFSPTHLSPLGINS